MASDHSQTQTWNRRRRILTPVWRRKKSQYRRKPYSPARTYHHGETYHKDQRDVAEYLLNYAKHYQGFEELCLRGDSKHLAVDDYCMLAKHIVDAEDSPLIPENIFIALDTVLQRREDAMHTHEYMLSQMRRLRRLFQQHNNSLHQPRGFPNTPRNEYATDRSTLQTSTTNPLNMEGLNRSLRTILLEHQG
ncbi:hypothetical protein PG985_002469 [Apiospora marii]|uniref:uncharacterized protein n=1 Tax=Apiospora marii TaxID=335849 RepID=UPI00312EE7AC